MKRSALWLLALILVGCGPALPPSGDRLVVGTAHGLAMLDPDASRVLFSAAGGVISPDRAQVFAVTEAGLAVLDSRSGDRQALLPLPAGLVPRVASSSGAWVALSEPRGSAWAPAARSLSQMAIVARAGDGVPRELVLNGNFEPEAFSSDDKNLFVLEYLPPLAPDRYRVRQVVLATGQVEPLVDRWKKVPIPNEETMRGTGRQQVLAPDRSRLYTLYTHQPDHLHGRDLAAGIGTARGDVHAFVHVLNLVEGWAFCVDLPLPFGMGPAEAHAIAVSPDGRRVVVVDRTSGVSAIVDTESLEVRATVEGAPDPRAERGLAAAQFSPDGSQLYVAGGSEVLVLDGLRLAVTRSWPAAGVLSGLAISGDGERLYLGLEGRVAVLDARTGHALNMLNVPELRVVGLLV